MKRRTAIAKIKRLAPFNRENYAILLRRRATPAKVYTEEEIDEAYEAKSLDVCAICYCPTGAHEARITNCEHVFHFICLRKAVYMKDTCPMCSQMVYHQGEGQAM